jgi:hypothetical protein
MCIDNNDNEEIYTWLNFKYNLDTKKADELFKNVTLPMESKLKQIEVLF